MRCRVLVAYASPCGSTAEIAEAAGQALAAKGADVRVCDVADIHDVTDYDAVLLGTAIRMGRPVRPMRAFVEKHAEAVAARPNAVFSVGTTPKERTARAVSEASGFISSLVTAVAPLSVAMFAGKVDPTRLPLPWRALVEHAEPGSPLSAGDWRDWDAIDEWVQSIAPLLLAGDSRPTTLSATPG